MARILVVDDDLQVRKFISSVLTRAGHDILGAGDGHEGLALYREEAPDLVVIDIIMPEKEGIETIIELKRLNPGVRIIAISGGGRVGPEGYLMTARGLGAMETLQKPFTMEELVQSVDRVLGFSKAEGTR